MNIVRDMESLKAQPHELQAVLQQIMKKTGVPGISAAVLHDGQVTSAAVGLRTTTTPSAMCAESRFRLGSLGKFLFCIVAAESIVSRQLDRDASLRTYLPELGDSEMGRNVALWQVISHTGGCYQKAEDLFEETSEPNGDWASVVRRSIAARRLFAPGAVFSYATPNYVLFGEVLRRLYGSGPRDLIGTRLLDPLGIDWRGTDSSRNVEGHNPRAGGVYEATSPGVVSELWESASSSLTLSMPDLVMIAASIIDAPIAPRAVLSDPARRILLEQVVELPIAPEWPVRDCAHVSYGFGCAVHRNGLLGHSGVTTGQCSAVHFDPVRRTAVAVGVNAHALGAREAALSMLMRSMGYSSAGAESKRVTFDPGELVGDYVGGVIGRVLEVRADGRELVCQASRRQGITQAEGSRKAFPVIRFQVTDEGHAVLDEPWRAIPVCFFREPGGETPCLFAGTVSYRKT